MKVSADQADALGGCQECQPATTPKVTGTPGAAAAVLTVDPNKPDWIGIELKTPQGDPVPNEAFLLELPGGRKVSGHLDNLGKVRVEGVDPGKCTVTFPDRDSREWKKK
jgi:hypothetical protein